MNRDNVEIHSHYSSDICECELDNNLCYSAQIFKNLEVIFDATTKTRGEAELAVKTASEAIAEEHQKTSKNIGIRLTRIETAFNTATSNQRK